MKIVDGRTGPFNKLPADISLRVFSETSFLPLAASFAKCAGEAYGFGGQELPSVELSAEEVFAWLCRLLGPAEPVEICVRNDLYRLTLRFLFKPNPLNLRVLNITAQAPLEPGADLEDLGLFLAVRLVDAVKLTSERDGRTCLALVVDRRYTEETAAILGQPMPVKTWRIQPADRESIQFFAARVKAHYAAGEYPGFLDFPGRAADMIAAGDLEGGMAVAESGAVCGGILWRWVSHKMLEMLGPFAFPPTQPPALPEALLEHLVEWAAKSPAAGILCRRRAGQPMPLGFDLLGGVCGRPSGQPAGETCGFRQLREDEGSAVCCHPLLESFLREQYERLALPRELRVIPFQGTGKLEATVLTAETDRGRREVLLKGLCFGLDAAEQLRKHLGLFAKQDLSTILFELDLGVAWQSAFVPALLATGFVPWMIVPGSGQADTVVFQKA
jgi:hypothetical protein